MVWYSGDYLHWRLAVTIHSSPCHTDLFCCDGLEQSATLQISRSGGCLFLLLLCSLTTLARYTFPYIHLPTVASRSWPVSSYLHVVIFVSVVLEHRCLAWMMNQLDVRSHLVSWNLLRHIFCLTKPVFLHLQRICSVTISLSTHFTYISLLSVADSFLVSSSCM